MGDEQRNVTAPCRQTGQGQRIAHQAVVEIGAETAFMDSRFQRWVRRRDDARGTAPAFEQARGADARLQPGLQGSGQPLDVVE